MYFTRFKRAEERGGNESSPKHFIHHGFTVTPVRSSYELQSTSPFMVNFKINGRFNGSMLDDKIYSSLLHVIRKCVRIPSVLNIIQVVNPSLNLRLLEPPT